MSKITKTQRVLRTILGIVIIPLLAAIYMIDRFIMVFIAHMPAPSGLQYLDDTEYIKHSILRVISAVAILGVYTWLISR